MKSYKEIEKLATFYRYNRVKCKCGHSVLVTEKNGKQLCTWCNRYVFATPELEKEYRLKEIKNRIGEIK